MLELCRDKARQEIGIKWNVCGNVVEYDTKMENIT
jgi:hypothetical protein